MQIANHSLLDSITTIRNEGELANVRRLLKLDITNISLERAFVSSWLQTARENLEVSLELALARSGVRKNECSEDVFPDFSVYY